MTTKTLSIRLAIILLLLMPLSLLTGKTWAETVNVNFIVLALDGSRALTISNRTINVSTTESKTYMYTQFPDEYKSPFLDNGDLHYDDARKGDYAFYRSESQAQESLGAGFFKSDKDTHWIGEVTSDLEGMNIFVVYRYDVSKSKAKGFLSGGSYTLKTFNNKVNNNEWVCYQGTWDTDSKPVTIGTEKYETNTWRSNLLYEKKSYDAAAAADKSKYRYTLNIDDPYQVTIMGNVNVMVNGVHQDREDWYLCGGKNPGDIRLQPTLAGAKTYHLWSYAILPGYNTNTDPKTADPTVPTYRIIVTDNYNYYTARNYSNWGNSFTNPNTPDGHYYLNNRGLSTKTCFHLRGGGSADIREGANHVISLLDDTRFSFVVKTHVNQKKLIHYEIHKYLNNDTVIQIPNALKRKYCTYELYLDSNFTTRIGEGQTIKSYTNAYEAGHTVFYVKYTVSGVPFQFSTEDHPKWYSLRTGTAVQTTTDAINANYKYIHYDSNSYKDNIQGVDMAADNSFWFAFIGDPYEVKVINRKAGTNKYMGIAANANTGKNIEAKNGATDQTVWSMVDFTGTPSNQFYLRLYGLDKTPAHVVYVSGKTLTFNVGAAPLLVEKIAGYDYVYKIVNNSGNVALQYTAKDVLPGEAPLDAMPDHIKSPAAKDYRFYKSLAYAKVKDETGTENENGIVGVLSDTYSSGDDTRTVYVRYTADNFMISKPYDMKVNGKYIYVDGSDNIGMDADASGQPMARRSWVFDGTDPYKIKLRTMSSTSKWLTDATDATDPTYSESAGSTNYAFLYGNGEADNYALALANGQIDGDIQYLGRKESDDALHLYAGSTNDPETSEVTQVILEDVQAMCSYTIIDNNGEQATRLYEKVKAFPMAVPDKIKSPLAKNWRYYTNIDDAQNDATENSRTGAVTSFTYDQFLSGVLDVYVRYDNDSSVVKMNAADATTNNPFYTLEFTDQSSPKQYMESSNVPTDNYERPSWSYVNGFGQFYLYGDQLHNEIFSEGKSNRTRFLWYFQGNDPYNLQIMSYQKRSSKNMYFRTYYDNGLDKVVTVLTQKDYKLLNEGSGDELNNDSIPSNYMILGTLDAAQFTTREYFSGEQHTVEQLEHGWRYAGESAGTDEIEELFAQKNMKAHHLDVDAKHWFTTVQMGKTIKIHEEELVPVLVLVDRHGWRLKYWPFSRRNDDAIKLFNSPMVTNYRWYYDGQVSLTGEEGGTNTISKTSGYYHYVIPEDATPNFESPTLSWEYWNQHKTGSYSSVNINIYVTYDVEGAEGWTDTAGDENTPDCLIDKYGILGYYNYDADEAYKRGRLMSDQNEGEFLRSYYFNADSLYLNDNTISAEKLWKLERNPDIDAEMGYTESEQLTYSASQNLFDPYNMRIKTKDPIGPSGSEKRYYLTAKYDNETGDMTTLIDMTDDPGHVQATRREDDNIRQITGATWMYVQDLQGKPRLVPRFDKDYSLTDLSRMQETESMNFPEQWSRITPIKTYTLHVREQGSGKEVLTPTPTITARAFAGQPIQLKDEHRRHWCEYNEYHSKETSANSGVYTDTIKTFPYMGTDIYAVFDYSDDAPRFGKTTDDAWWYNMGVTSPTPKWANGTGPTDVAATATSTTNETKWLWGFVGTPYSFKVINNYDKKYLTNTGSLDDEASAASWTTPVGLKKDGTPEVPYFKLEGSSSYLVIRDDKLAVNTTAPTVDSNKITLVSKNQARFIIINNEGEVALDFTYDMPAEGLLLPKFARSPLVDITQEGSRLGYYFYKEGSVTSSGGTYSITNAADSLKLNYRPLFGETIYVRYAYDNSKSEIDLSGKGIFNIQNKYKGTEYYLNNVSGDKKWATGLTEENEVLGTDNKYLWKLWGNDPYNIHITNNSSTENYLSTTATKETTGNYVYTPKAVSGAYVNTALAASGTTFNSFALVSGSDGEAFEDCYHLIAAYPKETGTVRASNEGIFWYLGRRETDKDNKDYAAFLNSSFTPEAILDTLTNIALLPKNFVMVTYHLTRKVTGETMTSQPIRQVCKARIKMPDGWDRQYCTYTYQTRYNAANQTYGGSNPLVNVTLVPFLTPGDDDKTPEIDIYVDYTVGTLPFNLIKTEHNTKAEIESLTADVFKLDTYEQRLAKGFSDTKTDGYLYFMVMNTDNTFSKGNQYFLQRDKAKGRINYMSNGYELHQDNTKNVNKWPYSRVAEYYRASKLEPFRDESWLWAFAGDPYDLYVFNVEGVVQKEYDNMEDVTTTTYHPRHALNYETLSKTTTTKKDGKEVKTTTYEYVANTVAYTKSDDTFAGYRWGLGLPKGDNSDQTFSLMVNEMDEDGNFVPDGTTTPRYLQYTKSAIDNANELVLTTRADDYKKLDYNIMVLPYKPTRYEDVQLEIRRLDNIFENMSDVGTGTHSHTATALVPQTSGISELYYAASTREFAAGDKISGNVEDLPVEAVRHFCDYTVYTDVYDVAGGYTVKAGPYRVGTEGDYTYKDKDGNEVASSDWPQRLYVSYKVTSDVFLKDHPTRAQVTDMVNNNDHVYFMDFTQNSTEGYKNGRHAYYDSHTFFTKDEKTTLKKDGSGEPVLIDVKDNEGNFIKDKNGKNVQTVETVYDKDNDKYNNKHFNTTTNRMESVPENLKWYFVGDPYKVQVYCTAGDWNKEGELKDGEGKDIAAGTVAANLCRFDPTESRFQYIVDCVHLRVPDTSTKDPRPWLVYYEENATTLKQTGKVVENPNYNKPLYDNFYWEVVPSIKGSTGAGKDYFALRFKRDNVQLKYKGVYYYLAGADKSKKYLDGTYGVNLSYNSDNATYNTGTNKDLHTANDQDCIIKLVQPAKVYISAYKPDDQNLNDYAYPVGERVTNEELSEYFGVGETLTEVPQHLKRKFVEYGMLTNAKNNATSDKQILESSNTVAYNLETCEGHTTMSIADENLTYYRINNGGASAKDKMKKRASYKFKVNYRTADLSNGDGTTVNLFTTQAAFNIGRIQWLDFTVGTNRWPYFDKLETAKTALVSNYRTAVDDKTADGWNDGLKGLHWAFVGDPYDFTIVNRRRYEDNTTSVTNPSWLAGKKTTIENYKSVADSVVWLATLANATTDTKTSKATAALADDALSTHWSLQMWKTGSSKDYFLRTASLKTDVADDSSEPVVGDYSNDYSDGSGNRNQTNNFWRMVQKPYTDEESTKYYFEAVPFSLADKGTYSTSKTASNYSQTMKDAGVTENLLDVRTAVAKDEDRANNDCFDAHVRIVNNDGVERIALQENMEIRFDDVTEALPYSLRRYGCKYKCYIDYVNNDSRGIEVKNFDSDVYDESDPERIVKDSKTFRQLVAEAQAAHTPLTLTYVYTYDDVTDFFTTEKDAKTEDYTWLNTYFNWMQKFKGTNVEREYYDRIFDHYVYNADGHIIDEVYRYVRKTEIISNADTEYETQAFLNTHTTQEPVYADEGAQSEDDRQKWALVGDPYSFTMKNYAQYVSDTKATVTTEGNRAVTTNLPALAQEFALALDENDGVFLALIDNKNIPTSYLTFDYGNTSDKIPYKTGTGTNTKDPTGNTIDTGGAKNFALANLLRYADLLDYHLVIAHQHSLDHTDDANADVNTCINNHLYEFLKYRGLYEYGDSTSYLTYTKGGVPNGTQPSHDVTVESLLKKYGTLRDLYTYPIEDNTAARVGIGNHPQVPWYMKRQFCTYYCYQRDVMRSVVDYDSKVYAVADQAWIDAGKRYKDVGGVLYKQDPESPFADKTNDNLVYRTFFENGVEKRAYNIMWVSVTNKKYWNEAKGATAETDSIKAYTDETGTTYRKMPKYYNEVMAQNGHRLERLNESHYNRKVVIDVVYEVNTDQFRFADQGRNTTAWYQLMTNNDKDGLMNFSYLNGIGAQQNRSTHYTNDYLWAPEGDPYGFVLRSRYATVNGSGWDDVVVTTTGTLPKASTPDATPDEAGLTATYTGPANTSSTVAFNENIIVQPRSGESGATTDGATNAVYEMMMGSFQNSFLMRPTAAWTDINDSEHESYYMTHVLASNTTKLVKASPSVLMTNADANWRLLATTSQLLPYFQRAGYVGGLQPLKAQDFDNEEIYNQLRQHDKAGTQPTFTLLRKAQELVYTPANLVALGGGGYYRIAGFSTVALNMAEGATGIQGQRYVSGYRFLSETGGETPENAKPLRFFETAKDNATIHTFADLATAKGFSDATPGSTVLQGNIELLPADFDPSSIFHFEPVTGGVEGRYTLSTQGLKVSGVSGVSGYSRLSGTPGDATPLRIDDIGGAAVTLRILGEGTVGTHIKTNYLNSNGDSYALTFTNSNELNETPSGIQDTKWLLQPVGVKEQWPYNQMPLRVEVHQGGVKDQKLTGDANKDPYYYGTLCVPFDARMSSTIDAAFTLVNAPTAETEKVTMQSVSQYNGMGNPQYVPAAWPVVMRTNKPGSIELKNQDGTDYATKYYVNMYLPYDRPQTVVNAKNQLSGQLLEQDLGDTDAATVAGKRVMAFGLPFADHTVAHGDAAADHEYDRNKQVGWYSNDNWAREQYSGYIAHARNYAATGTTGTVAADDQRSNTYVYHNRIYLLIDEPTPARRHIVALFDGEPDEQEWQEDRPISEEADMPWPCDVYDLQGRRVAENETPQTLRKNHPSLRKGVYIFGGHKVVVR